MRNIKLHPIQHVLSCIEAHFDYKTTPVESVPLLKARHRFVAEDILSDMTLPPYRKSTVDGYAVKLSKDVQQLTLKDKRCIGFTGDELIGDDTIYVPTGGRVPEDAEAMIKIEDTTIVNGQVHIQPCLTEMNIIEKGEDLTPGKLILKKGKKINTFDIGVLASLGHHHVTVYQKPTVGILSTGDELIPVDGEYVLGKTRDINGMTLSCLAEDYGLEVAFLNIQNDDYTALKTAVLESHKRCDITLISGGSSMGEKDYTFDIIKEIGEVITDGIALKPGKPTIIGMKNNRPIIGLPGHPVSAIMVFKVIMPTLLQKYHIDITEPRFFEATIAKDIKPAKGRDTYQMLHFKNGEAYPTSGKSGMMTLLSLSEGYTIIDKSETLKRGDRIKCYSF